MVSYGFFIAVTLHKRIKIEVIIFFVCVQTINTDSLALFRCIQNPKILI